MQKSWQTHLDTVDVGLDVASLVQIYNMHRAEELATFRKCCRSDPIQDLLTCRAPPQTLSLSVAVDCLNVQEKQSRSHSLCYSEEKTVQLH